MKVKVKASHIWFSLSPILNLLWSVLYGLLYRSILNWLAVYDWLLLNHGGRRWNLSDSDILGWAVITVIALCDMVLLGTFHALVDPIHHPDNKLNEGKCPANPDCNVDHVHLFQALVNFILDRLDVYLRLGVTAFIDNWHLIDWCFVVVKVFPGLRCLRLKPGTPDKEW